MEDLIDFLMRNPWLILLIIMGVLGNLGSTKAKQRPRRRPSAGQPQANRSPDPLDEPAPPAGEDDIGRRIRELLGQPQIRRPEPPEPAEVEVRAEAPPAPEAAPETIETFESFEGGVLEAGAQPLSSIEPARGWERKTLSGEAATAPVKRRRRRVSLGGRLRPRRAFYYMMLFGQPRAVEAFEDDPTRRS